MEGKRGEHISAIARTTNEIGETRLQIIQLERAFKEQVETDLRQVADELVDLQERRIAAQHTLDHIEIRAPVTGTVVGLSVHTVGGVIAPGGTVGRRQFHRLQAARYARINRQGCLSIGRSTGE